MNDVCEKSVPQPEPTEPRERVDPLVGSDDPPALPAEAAADSEEQERLDLPRDNGEEHVPIGLSVQWPLIQLGRSMRNAVLAYRKFFSVSADDLKSIYRNRAQKAAECGDNGRRVLYMEKVVALDPDDVDAVYALGLAYERGRDQRRAQACYRRVTQMKPDHARAHFRIGTLLMQRKEYEGAIKAFNRALELEPSSPELYFRLGQAYDRELEHDKAIECFEKAIKIDGEFLPAYKHMALTYDSVNKHRKALDCLKRALELEERSA